MSEALETANRDDDAMLAQICGIITHDYDAADPLQQGFRPAASTLGRDVMAVVDTFMAPLRNEVERLRAELDAELEVHDQHDREQRAAALREAAEGMRLAKESGHWNLRVTPEESASPDVWLERRADRIEVGHDE